MRDLAFRVDGFALLDRGGPPWRGQAGARVELALSVPGIAARQPGWPGGVVSSWEALLACSCAVERRCLRQDRRADLSPFGLSRRSLRLIGGGKSAKAGGCMSPCSVGCLCWLLVGGRVGNGGYKADALTRGCCGQDDTGGWVG